MSRFISERFRTLAHYIPGEQPADTQYIKLNTNESPYPPSPAVLDALNKEESLKLNLYPNPDGTALIAKLAETYGVKPENIIIGNGSDELLAFSFLAFFGDGVAFPDITYGFYPVYANLFGVPYTQIPLRDDFTINIDDYIDIGKNIVLANPNAPTGTALGLGELESIISSNPNHLILVDEAYIDFGADSALTLLGEYDNLLIIHTYSKARSMAGARLAYAIASKPVIDDLNKIKYSFNPYNVNRLTQVAGLAALEDDAYYKQKQQEIVDTREEAAKRLAELDFEMTESKANFLFAKNKRISGKALYQGLKENGILVRHWDRPRISDYVRITIGTKEQMEKLYTAIMEVSK